MIDQVFAQECHIFLCYRNGGAEIAKNFKKALAGIPDRHFGYVWYSDQENMGNFVEDPYKIIPSARYAVLFLEEGFTRNFLVDGKNNYGDDTEGNVGCVTVREIVEIERCRQAGHLTVIGVHINGYLLSPEDIRILRQVFQNEGILTPTSLGAYTELNQNPYYPRKTDVDLFAADLSRGMEKGRKPLRAAAPKVHIDGLVPPLGYHYYGRESAFELVDDARKTKTCINLTAPAGSGKSAFVFHWLSRMAPHRYHGAEYVLYWSFDPDGRDCAISSNLSDFLEFALSFLGIAGCETSGELEKAIALSDFMEEHAVLLILDGIDTFQSTEAGQEGLLQNQSIKKIVTSVARSTIDGQSLLLLLSAAPVADLQYYTEQAQIIPLPKLTAADCVRILRDLGINGSEKELTAAVNELNCDPMAITLMGKILSAQYNGSIQERYRIRYNGAQTEQMEQILTFYEGLWPLGSGLGIVLALCCLFRRGTDHDGLRYLLEQVADLPDLAPARDVDLRAAVAVFRKMGVVYGEYDINLLPAVKERYRRRFREHMPQTFRRCNLVLGDDHAALCDDAAVDTVAELLPLYDAIFYYTQADQPGTAVSILWNRVFRKRQFFSQKRLGATTNDLFAISLFFDVSNDWKPHPSLSQIDAAWLSSVAAYLQNNIGNLRESEVLRRRELAIYGALQHHLFLASDGQNLARNLMLQGKLEESEQQFLLALEALEAAAGRTYAQNPYAQDIDGEQLRTNICTRYAYLLFLRGKSYWDSANQVLESLSADRLRETTTGMFYYCYIRLHTAHARNRAAVCAQIEKTYLSSFDRSKRHETAYANLLRAQIAFARATGWHKNARIKECTALSLQAIRDAKAAGRMDQLPLVLIEVLALYLELFEGEKNDTRRSEYQAQLQTVIDELEETFLLHELPVYKLDYLFLKARYHARTGDGEKARALQETLGRSPICIRYFTEKLHQLRTILKEYE